MPPVQSGRDGVTVSTDPARLDLSAIDACPTRSYWCPTRSYWAEHRPGDLPPLCDVCVLEPGMGSGRRLMERVIRHPQLQRLRRFPGHSRRP